MNGQGFSHEAKPQGLGLIAQALEHNMLPHAYLVVGPAGSGKGRFLEECARFLLCMEPDTSPRHPRACMACMNCLKFQRGVHPDFIKIEPVGRYIRIDQVRALQKLLSFAPLEAERRICTIGSADKLNIDASNALLKTLEEPPEDTYLLLAAESPSRLLPTIVSRCQMLHLGHLATGDNIETALVNKGYTPEEASFLKHLSGRSLGQTKELETLGALKIRNSIFEFLVSRQKYSSFFTVSNKISQSRQGLELAIRIFRTIARDLILLTRLGDGSRSVLVNADKTDQLTRLAQNLNCDSLFQYQARLEQAERFLERNVNPEMISDMLLVFWLKMELEIHDEKGENAPY